MAETMTAVLPVAPVDLDAERAELGPGLLEVVRAVFESNGFVLGPRVAAFEKAFAEYHHARFGVGVGSGTDALVLSMKALGIGQGQRVLTSPFTFFASAGVIRWVGATPQLSDVDPETGLLDLEQARSALTPETTCVLPVHLYGQLVDVRGFRALADEHGIALLEDAAQAHGASRDGLFAGQVGDATAFSFYPTKNLGAAGEGGAVLCNDPAILECLHRQRDHGSTSKYVHTEIGTNSRLHTIQAAVLHFKLPHLAGWNDRRRAVAAKYSAGFANSNAVSALKLEAGSTHAYHQYGVRIHGDVPRDQVLKGLHERKIFAAVHYPTPVHLQPAAESWGYRRGEFPGAEQIAREILCLPIHPFLQQEQVERVIASVLELAEGPRQV